MCNFGRMHHEEQFCEIILKLGQWFSRRCRLKIFIIWSSGSPVQWSRTICAILKEGIMGNIHVKLYKIAERNHLCKFGRGYQEEHFSEIILNLDQWFRRRCF